MHIEPQITIVGLGLIGGSLALDLRKQGVATRIVGSDTNAQHAQKALELGIADAVLPLEAALQGSQIILLTTPVNVLIHLLPQVLDAIEPTQVVLDAGSTKLPVLDAVRAHPKRAQFLATHPMAGTEYSGPEAAVYELFRGKRCVFCDVEESAPWALEQAQMLYERIGMQLIYLGAAEHDLHVAYVSHISHIASFALALTVLEKERKEERIFELASGGFGSTARLAKSNANTWIPIFEQNRDNVLDVLDEFINTVSRFRTLLIKKDFATFDQLIRQANDIRRIIER